MNAKPDESRRPEALARGGTKSSSEATATRSGRKRLATRNRQYTVTPTSPGLDEGALVERLEQLGDVEIVRTIASRGMEGPPVAVVRVAPEKLAALRQLAGGALAVEPDAPLRVASLSIPPPRAATVAYPLGEGFSTIVQVLNDSDQPLAQAEVQIIGRQWTAQGTTGSDGKVALSLHG